MLNFLLAHPKAVVTLLVVTDVLYILYENNQPECEEKSESESEMRCEYMEGGKKGDGCEYMEGGKKGDGCEYDSPDEKEDGSDSNGDKWDGRWWVK